MKTVLPPILIPDNNLGQKISDQPTNQRPEPVLYSQGSWKSKPLKKENEFARLRSIANSDAITERNSVKRPYEFSDYESPKTVSSYKSKQLSKGRRSDEKLVGRLFPAKIGMEVEYSMEAIKYFNRTQPPMPGLITSIDPDGQMCMVSWEDGTSDYSCTGYSSRLPLYHNFC